MIIIPAISWKTKTELNQGTLSGDAEIVGLENLPIITVFDEDVSSVDTDVVVSYESFSLYTTPPATENVVPTIASDLSSFISTGNINVVKTTMKITWV